MSGNESDYADLAAHIDHIMCMQNIIYTYVAVPLVVIGLVWNGMAFWVLGKMVHQNATTFLLRVLAVMDSCVVLITVLHLYGTALRKEDGDDTWIQTTTEILGPYVMTYILPVYAVVNVANVWTTVLVGLNRYIVVCHPFQAVRFCTTSKAKKQVICVILCSIVYGLPKFFDYKLQRNADGSALSVKALIENKLYFYIYHVGCAWTFRFLIPAGMLIFFCVRLIIALRVARKQPITRHGAHQDDTRITSMLVFLLGIFLIYQICVYVIALLNMFLPMQRHIRIWLYATFPVIKLSHILNSSVNWLIYVAYIKEFRKILCECCTCSSQQNHVRDLSNLNNMSTVSFDTLPSNENNVVLWHIRSQPEY